MSIDGSNTTGNGSAELTLEERVTVFGDAGCRCGAGTGTGTLLF